MTKKAKYYPAKRNAILSLQFYRDKEGTPNFMITSNPPKEGECIFTGIDQIIFAKNLLNANLVSREEIEFLCDFFDQVRKRLDEPPDPKYGPTKEPEKQKKHKELEFFMLGAIGNDEEMNKELSDNLKAFTGDDKAAEEIKKLLHENRMTQPGKEGEE